MSESVPITDKVAFETSGVLIVSDPCYVDEAGADFTGGLSAKLDAKPGTWIGRVEVRGTAGWGDRVARLVAHADGHHGAVDRADEHITELGVDSGQMYVADASHLPVNYDAVCEVSLANRYCGATEGGIVSRTGYGDGCYRLSVAKDSDGKVVALVVDFDVEEGS